MPLLVARARGAVVAVALVVLVVIVLGVVLVPRAVVRAPLALLVGADHPHIHTCLAVDAARPVSRGYLHRSRYSLSC